MERNSSFGFEKKPGVVDRIGQRLSTRKARKFLGNCDGQTVGDIGCGYDAQLARNLFKNAAQIHLFDLQVDESLHSDRVLIHCGKLPDTLEAIPDQTFDALLFNNVLEHLEQPALTLEHIHRLLRSDGRLFINVPTWRGKIALEFAAFRLKVAPESEMNDHKTYYDKRSLWPILVKAGFRPSNILMRSHKGGLNLFAYAKRVDRVGDEE